MAVAVDPNERYKKKKDTVSDFTKNRRKRQEEEEASKYSADELKKAEEEKKEAGKSNVTKGKDLAVGFGRFVKGIGTSIKDDAVNTWQGLGDVGRGELAGNSLDKITDQRMEMTKRHSKEMNEILGNAEDATKLDAAGKKKWDEYVSRSNKEREQFDSKFSGAMKEANQDIETAQKVDAKKTALASGSTFLNATGVYALAAGLTKAVGVQGLKVAAEQGSKSAAKQLASQAAKRAAAEGTEQVVKSTGKRVAARAGEDALFGAGYGAIEGAKAEGAGVDDILKGAAIGGVLGGGIGAGGELLSTGVRSFLGKGSKNAIEELNALKKETPEQKLLTAGEPAPVTNKSTTTVKGADATPERIPMDETEYSKRFDKLSKSYDNSIKAAEKEKSSIKQRTMSDAAHDDHLAQLEQLNDEFLKGKPNPNFKAATPDQKVETGFEILTPEQSAAKAGLTGERRQAHIRSSQIDKIVSEAQQKGTTRTPDELRALMREREALQGYLDGGPKPDGLFRKGGEPYAPPSGIDAAGVTKQTGEQASKLITDETAGIRSEGVRAKFQEIFAPIKNLSQTTQASFKQSAGARHVADVRAKEVADTLRRAAKESDTELDFDLAMKIEDGTAPQTEFTKQFREIADNARKDAVDSGLDIGYRENYVPHIWKQSPDKVERIARSAGLKARAEGERIIPTYEEGLKLGLKPKYKNPADMMADYVRNLETVRGNVSLISDLRSQGLLKTGKAPAGWETISAKGFPRSSAQNQFSAPPEVATVLNNMFGKSDSIIEKGLRKTAGLNSAWQDIALAGGIPHTPANFFTFSQMAKEAALGTGQIVTGSPIKGARTALSPVATFIRSFSDKSTTKFMEQNKGLVEALAKRGAPIDFAQTEVGRTAKQGLKDAFSWNKLFNEPTFGRFMPNLQLSTAKNVSRALEKKMGKEEALDATAEIMKKMYGITDDLATGRSQGVQDLIGSVAFAPKYRESIVNVLVNTARSLSPTNWKDQSYSLNRRLAAGIGVTYIMYDQLNKQTTGHGMNENPEGKELQLAIPYGTDKDGNAKVAYIPFMPSFMTIPRAIVGIGQGIAKSDTKQVTSEGGKFLSMPIQTITQLASNKDYFGRAIVNDETAAIESGEPVDDAVQQFIKRGIYVAGQASPGAVRAGIGVAQGKPAEQNAATALEVPVRFGKFSKISDEKASFAPGEVTSDFYKQYNTLSARRKNASKEVTNLIQAGKPAEARRKANEFNDTIRPELSKYYKKYGGKNPSDEDFWDEMIEGLPIRTSERAFTARSKD